MIQKQFMTNNLLPKRSPFVRNANLFEKEGKRKGKKDEDKKNSGFGWSLDETKFLQDEEVRKLLTLARENKGRAEKRGRKVAVKDYYIIKVGLSTGLRVREMADLQCGDFELGKRMSSLFVRQGKGGRSRRVWFNGELKQGIADYLAWKEKKGEDTSSGAPFFLSSNTQSHLTTRALQKSFKRTLARAGLGGYSIHATRHTYASNLYRASGYNLRLVQKQLGHSSIRTTQIYADVFTEDMEKALERLYD